MKNNNLQNRYYIYSEKNSLVNKFLFFRFYFFGRFDSEFRRFYFNFSFWIFLLEFQFSSISPLPFFPFFYFLFFSYPYTIPKLDWIGQVYFIVDTKKNLGQFRQGSPVSQLFIYQIILANLPNNRQATASRNPATEQAKPGRNSQENQPAMKHGSRNKSPIYEGV